MPTQTEPAMKQVTRYHPLLVALHWLLAFLLIAALFAGFFLLAPMPNSDPQKIRVLLVHMVIGMAILALMLVRFVIRMLTSHPEPTTTGYPFLDRIAPVTHYGFYVLVVLMVATGYATAILAGLNRIVFQRSGEPLPEDFDVYPTFIAHSFFAAILAGFVVLHVLAALYHQFVRRDRLFRRIWFGRRVAKPATPAQ
jgi:cytochrome b561